MTDRISEMRKFFITEKRHHAMRQAPNDAYCLANRFQAENTPPLARAVLRLKYMLENEVPVVFDFEKIALLRTVPQVPELFTKAEDDDLRSRYWLHETGDFNNFAPDYMLLIGRGFTAVRQELVDALAGFDADSSRAAFVYACLETLDLLSAFAERYRQKAVACGNTTVAASFSHIPANPPRTLLEAFQFFRLLHYGLWCANSYQATVGRLDQFFYPYYVADMAAHRYDADTMLELCEEFFLSFNRDSDLYPGVQQGDNGQTLVLGGMNPDGSDSYNAFSALLLTASLNLRLIDPKINLRVSRDTPLSRYVEATMLTRQGLGFPQYLNDDVNIPALLQWGYDRQDAYNYSAAACWELIIPGQGADVPNADGYNFAGVVLSAIQRKLADCESFDVLLAFVKEDMEKEAGRLIDKYRDLYLFPAPLTALMMHGCGVTGFDVLEGCKYQNIGFHGVGLSTAADSLCAVRYLIYETGQATAQQLLQALSDNFDNEPQMLSLLRLKAPKVGNNDDAADSVMTLLLNQFADALEGHKNDRGGVYRAGTASAMYYIWYGDTLPATPDGRKTGEPLPANYSPSLFAKLRGPLSTVLSFTKPNLVRTANGGPLTLELHDTVFHSEDSTEKVAQIVKLFIDRGGHELQINAVNRENMLEAQKRPADFTNMIVRVWGWSGYFVELGKEYQDQIIKRTEFMV